MFMNYPDNLEVLNPLEDFCDQIKSDLNSLDFSLSFRDVSELVKKYDSYSFSNISKENLEFFLDFVLMGLGCWGLVVVPI